MKTLWLTSLSSAEDRPKLFGAQMKKYGLDVKGHFWTDDLKKMAWTAARDELISTSTLLWAILASDDELLAPDNQYGLSALAITVQAQRGHQFPIVILQTQGELLSSEQLGTPFKSANVISFSDSGLGPKLVSKAHMPAKSIPAEYYIDIIANEQIGQWFEVRPTQANWPGVMFGVTGADIAFHAVGPKGLLPDKSVLNYPMQGLKLQMGEKEYLAWAVQNELDPETSYFVKVDGNPAAVIFGPYSEEQATDVFALKLK